MHASTLPADTTILDGEATSLQQARRLQRRRAQRLRMLGLVAASYGIDSLMIALLAAAGVVSGLVPLVYAGTAAICLTAFYLALGGSFAERQPDHYLTLHQVAANSLLLVGFMLWVPQIGILLMMVLFIVFAFGALRMSPGLAVSVVVVTALPVGAVLALVGDRLGLPTDTGAQRLVSGLWFATVLMRSVGLGLFGARLREVLAERNQELAATFARLEHLAARDALTGAYNRRRILERLDDERQRLARGGAAFAVVLFDLDHFKRVNDSLGHAAGDEVLQRFVRLVESHIRSLDRIGRFGGEEFLLVLPGTANAAAAREAVERIRVAIARAPWGEVSPGLAITVSAGAAVADVGEDASVLVARADRALYRAKHGGRNAVVVD
jgi:diguanylate cyclase (GGDEF)-like protein